MTLMLRNVTFKDCLRRLMLFLTCEMIALTRSEFSLKIMILGCGYYKVKLHGTRCLQLYVSQGSVMVTVLPNWQ